MKRILLIFLSLILLLGTPLSVFAAEQKIVDDAGLLSETEREDLESIARQLSERYSVDVVIVTINSLNGKTSESYADDYYDDNGYGYGNDYSGILLLLSMEYRDWAISTCGEGIYALTDYSVQDVFSQISGYLSQDLYYLAFSTYLDALKPYLDAYRSGKPIDGDIGDYEGPGIYIPGTQDNVHYFEPTRDFLWYIKRIGIAFAIGLVVALIVLLILRSQMNTAKPQRGAASYLLPGSYRVELQRDIFLYSQVRKVRKTENSSSGGGSSVHRSSSGRSHGGGHGKF